MEKCMSFLITKYFKQVDRTLLKHQNQKYKYYWKKLNQRFPHRFMPRKFYQTAKLHKLHVNGKIDDLPLRPSVKHQASYISVREAHIKSTISIERIRTTYQKYKRLFQQIKNLCQQDIKWCYLMWNHFSNVPLDQRIDIILRRIYDHKATCIWKYVQYQSPHLGFRWQYRQILLGYQARIFHFSFFNVSHESLSFITWNLIEYLHIQDFQKTPAHLNIWTNTLFCNFSENSAHLMQTLFE